MCNMTASSAFTPVILMLVGVAALFGDGRAARADVTAAQSEGYGIQVDLSILNVLSIDLLNLTPAQRSFGAAPGTYAEAASLVSVSTTVGTTLGPILNTAVGLDLATVDGVLNSSAESDVDGNPGIRGAQAFGQVNDLELGVLDAGVTVLGIPTLTLDLVNVAADTISSTASVTGNAGALVANGDSVIQNLVIEVNGVELNLLNLLGANAQIDVDNFLTVLPNTQLVNIGGVVGLNLILNEQSVTGDGISSRGIEVNAVRLTLNGIDLGLPLVSETLNGDVRIGHAQASVVAVPEPACLMLLGGGLAMMTGRSRRRA